MSTTTDPTRHRPAHHRPGPGALLDAPALRRGRRPPAAHPRLDGHLRPRQRRRSGSGARPVLHGPAFIQGRNEQASRAHRLGLRQGLASARDARGHLVDRPGRAEHGHRCRTRHHQPASGAAAARRLLRDPPAGPGAAAAPAPGRGGHQRQRRVPPGLPVLRPHHQARAAAHRTACRHARAGRPGGHRCRGHLVAAGRPVPRVRLPGCVLRGARLDRPTPGARPDRDRGGGTTPGRGEPADRDRRRRGHLLRRLRGAGQARGDGRHARRRDLRRQGRRA